MADEPASTVATETGVSLDFMIFIQNDNLEMTGVQFRYDCSGVFADITMIPYQKIFKSYMYLRSVNLQIVESNGNTKVIRRDDLPPFNIY